MTPIEKAIKLTNQFKGFEMTNENYAIKEVSIIVIDEILLFSQQLGTKLYQEIGTDSYSSRCENATLASYYKEVKSEIEKL